jgi:hypothetical protein
MKKVFQVFAALALLGLVGSPIAAAAGGGKVKPDFVGKITKVDTDAKSVTFTSGKGHKAGVFAVQVDANTKISVDGKDAKLADLKADMYVSIFGQADQAATQIIASTTPPSNGKVKPDFIGTITKVDGDAKSITFTVGKGHKATVVTVLVDDKTKITIDGNDAKIGDLKADLYVSVFGQADMAAVQITASTTPPSGGKNAKGGNN